MLGTPARPILVRVVSHSTIVLSAALVGFFTAACGKPATAQDCERIVERITELELSRANVSDPVRVQSEVQAAQRKFKALSVERCVGRRLPASALDCVERAASAEKLLNECF